MMGRRAPEMPKIAPNTIRWINYDRALEQRSLFFSFFFSSCTCECVFWLLLDTPCKCCGASNDDGSVPQAPLQPSAGNGMF